MPFTGDVTIDYGPASGGAFDPADLFADGTRGGFWYDPQDFSAVLKETNPDVPVDAVGDAVVQLNDKANYGFAQTHNQGVCTIQQDANGNYYVVPADIQTGDGFWNATGYGGTNVSNMALFLAVKTADTAFIALATDNQTVYDAVAQSGSDSGVASNSPFGSLTYWDSDTQITNSPLERQHLHTAWAKGTGAGQGTVVNFRNMTWNNGQTYFMTRYLGGSGFGWTVNIYSVIAVENPTAQEISDIISYMQGLIS